MDYGFGALADSDRCPPEADANPHCHGTARRPRVAHGPVGIASRYEVAMPARARHAAAPHVSQRN
ncbi:hypothetical protein GCM10007079_49980 [Nocardiopsis terrae]|nr:hypothetical protein GCM10007079_49980 [Nocardiopsis terrae]